MYKISLRARKLSYLSEQSEPRLSSRVRAPRASTFHDIPQIKSLLAG